MKAITVPLDGSRFAELALSPALALASRRDATVDLVHVELPPPPTRVPPPKGERPWAAGYLAEVKSRISDVDDMHVTTTVLAGRPAAMLRDHLTATRPDFVIMATHGLGPLNRLWLGSVTDEVLRVSPVPVVVVRPREGARSDLRSDHLYRRILVPLDGSPVAEAALAPAAALARATGGEITLLRIAVLPVLVGIPVGIAVEPTASLHDERQDAVRYLEELVDRIEDKDVPTRFESRTAENAAEGILDCAREDDFDLIAMSNHGRRGVRRLVLGSVADKVVRGADVPVLVTRPV